MYFMGAKLKSEVLIWPEREELFFKRLQFFFEHSTSVLLSRFL